MLKFAHKLLSKHPTVVFVLMSTYMKLKHVKLRDFQVLHLLELPVCYLKYHLIIWGK